MSYSDYLSLKKIKNISKDKKMMLDQSSSNHVRRKQYELLQKTMILDEDKEIIDSQRFHIPIPPIYFPSGKKPKKKTMFSIPRIHVIEYVKNRYEPPFCWTCKPSIDELTKEIACIVCDSVQPIPEMLFDLQESIDIDMHEYLDGICNDSILFDLQPQDAFPEDAFPEDTFPLLRDKDVNVFDKIEEVREILEKENNITVEEDSKNITIENNILFL